MSPKMRQGQYLSYKSSAIRCTHLSDTLDTSIPYKLSMCLQACAAKSIQLDPPELADELRYDQLLSLFALQYQSVAHCYEKGERHHPHTNSTGRITKPPPFVEEGKAYQREKRTQPRGKEAREWHKQNTINKAKKRKEMEHQNHLFNLAQRDAKRDAEAAAAAAAAAAEGTTHS